MEITIGVLAFNEEASIGALLDWACAEPAGRHRVIELLVYDDGSTDATRTIVATAARQNRKIRLLTSPRRKGTMVGMQALAREARGDVLVRIDADTNPSAYAPEQLADAIAGGAAIAVGANEPIYSRRTLASLSASFASGVVERLKAGPYCEYYAVGRLIAYDVAALRRLEFPPQIINEDHYTAGTMVRNGGRAVFVPRAQCKFRVPLTFRDYSSQSRRILEGERQLERHGIARAPLRAVLSALAASARARPGSALCWALAYTLSCMQRAPASAQPWPIARSTKGAFA